MLEIFPSELIILRLAAECPEELLVAPDWTNRKQEIVAAINSELEGNDSYQGKYYNTGAHTPPYSVN
jgi:radical SAM superfamily enzyme